MPRNSSGTYTLPAGNPVAPNTLIETNWANPTLSDVAAGITDSLDRLGRGTMLAPLKLFDGTVVAPALSFNSEATTGLFRPLAGALGIAVTGAEVARFTAAGLNVLAGLTVAGATVFSGALALTGNLTATGAITGASFAPTGAAIPGNGMYLPGANTLGFATAGTIRAFISDTGMFAAAGGARINGPVPSNVALSSVNIGTVSNFPIVSWMDSTAAVDNRLWTLFAGGGSLHFTMHNDIFSVGPDWLTVTRSGTVAQNIIFPTGNVGIGFTATDGMKLDVNGGIRALGGVAYSNTKTGISIGQNSGNPAQVWINSGAPVDSKVWDGLHFTGGAVWRMLNDAQTIGNTWMEVGRTGASPTSITLSGTGGLTVGPVGGGAGVGKLNVVLSPGHVPGAGWTTATALFGTATTSVSSNFAISYDGTNGAYLMALHPAVAWKNISAYAADFVVLGSGIESFRVLNSGEVNIVRGSGFLRVGGHITRFESLQGVPAVGGAGGNVTVAHGGTRVPDSYFCALRCVIAEHGYTPGDEAQLVTVSGAGNFALSANATSMTYRQPATAGGPPAIYVAGGANSYLTVTPANWRIVFHALWL